MKAAAIIAEYNPFHNGHLYQLEQTRAQGATHLAVLLSGNFVQRGEPALLSKWSRAKMALLCGADLVVELPVCCSMAPAQQFAFGGVSLAEAMGCIDALSFGSECGDAATLRRCAEWLERPEFNESVRALLQQGMSYPKACGQALASLDEAAAQALLMPNDTLAVEYLRALSKLGSKIQPICIARVGAAHDDPEASNGFASASLLREKIRAGSWETVREWMPRAAFEILLEEAERGRAPGDIDYVGRAVLAKLRDMTQEELAALPEVGEGLENRIHRAAGRAGSLSALYDMVKSRRYTHARIRRICLSAFVGISAGSSRHPAPYIRVLGANRRGEELLHKMKTTAACPVVTRAAQGAALTGDALSVYREEQQADQKYGLCLPAVQPSDWGVQQPFIKL